MKILTKKGEAILISPKDYLRCIQFTWYVNKMGYAACDSGNNGTYSGTYESKRMLMHRLIMKFPKENVDHINGNKLDNRRSNLRICNQSQNSANTGKRTTNKSGYKGVSWNKKYKKWEAYLTHNYKHIFLGYFDSKDKAAQAYNNKAFQVWGVYAKLNII